MIKTINMLWRVNRIKAKSQRNIRVHINKHKVAIIDLTIIAEIILGKVLIKRKILKISLSLWEIQ